MDNVRRKNWLSVTAYVVISFCVLTLLLLIAETYFPSPSSDLMPRQPDRITRWILNSLPGQHVRQTADATADRQEKLFFPLNQKKPAGQSEFIYRGLVGRSEFQIDVIVPQLDPLVSYSYRLKISDAKKSFRLGNRTYRLISAKRGALQLEVIDFN